MICEEIRKLSSDYIDEELSPDMQVMVERHILGCKRCEIYLNTLRKTIELSKSIPKPPIPQDVSMRLHARLKAYQRNKNEIQKVIKENGEKT